MQPGDDRNGHSGEWDALAARLGRGLGRRPFSLDEARAAFAAAPAVRLRDDELETIIYAGAHFDAPAAPGSFPMPRSRDGRSAAHPLRHESLDRRDLPAPLTLLFCTADVVSVSSDPPQAIEVPSRISESAWISDLHTVDRDPWRGCEGWSPAGEIVASEARLDSPDWRDTFEIDSALELVGAASAHRSALAVTSTDVTHDPVFSHDAVFSHDGWRDE